MKNKAIPAVCTLPMAAKKLNISKRQLYRYVPWFMEHCQDCMTVLEYPNRRFYYFTEESLKRFAEAHGRQLATERTKRAYYRRSVKGQHTKRRKKS